MFDYTIWYAVKLQDKRDMDDLTQHLAMNGYTFDTNCDDTLFIFHEEIDYVETIMRDHGMKFERL